MHLVLVFGLYKPMGFNSGSVLHNIRTKIQTQTWTVIYVYMNALLYVYTHDICPRIYKRVHTNTHRNQIRRKIEPIPVITVSSVFVRLLCSLYISGSIRIP